MARRFEIVVLGATGFSGKLVAEYLARIANLRWAIAGRSRDKLEQVRTGLATIDPALAELPLVIADTDDVVSVEAMVADTQVMCTTVGPYRKYGAKVAHSCARSGTHYCDITGEVAFMRASIDDNHAAAEASGARLVHACGFDSVPFDLGVYLLRERARELDQQLAWARSLVAVRGRGAPGGVESAIAMIQDARRDVGLRRLSANPYALDPDRSRRGPDGPDQVGVRYDDTVKQWTAPFVMAMINTRVVRRSAALLGYGDGFRYSEAMGFGEGAGGFAKSLGMTVGLGMFAALALFRPAHRLLRQIVHGERPRTGFYRIQIKGETTAGTALAALVAGTGDAGCEPTAMMLGEAALSLARDALPARGGVLTPASAFGHHLIERVRRGGMTLELATV